MSSIDPRRLAPARLAPALLAVLLAGCASAGGGPRQAAVPRALNPLEQNPVRAEVRPQELALGVHADGSISPAQDAALARFAASWAAGGRTAGVSVAAPSANGQGDPALQARNVAARLAALGVPDAAIQVDTYDAGGDPAAPVVARFDALQAVAPDCQLKWDNLSSTNSNEVSKHFGCANARNMAAMLADPRDLLNPRAMTPADAGRRAVVLDRYRLGQVTSTAKDDQAAGAVAKTAR